MQIVKTRIKYHHAQDFHRMLWTPGEDPTGYEYCIQFEEFMHHTPLILQGFSIDDYYMPVLLPLCINYFEISEELNSYPATYRITDVLAVVDHMCSMIDQKECNLQDTKPFSLCNPLLAYAQDIDGSSHAYQIEIVIEGLYGKINKRLKGNGQTVILHEVTTDVQYTVVDKPKIICPKADQYSNGGAISTYQLHKLINDLRRGTECLISVDFLDMTAVQHDEYNVIYMHTPDKCVRFSPGKRSGRYQSENIFKSEDLLSLFEESTITEPDNGCCALFVATSNKNPKEIKIMVPESISAKIPIGLKTALIPKINLTLADITEKFVH